MFGYIQTFKPELKFKEFDIYRSYYCGLCMEIKKKYGNMARFMLSYDMIFLIILLDSLYEPESVYLKRRCIVSLKKRPMKINECTEYAADMLILFSYLKSRDDMKDEGKVSGFLENIMLSGKFKRLLKKYPKKIKKLQELTEKQDIIEKESCISLEKASDISGEMISVLFDYKNDIWQEKLKKIGFYLGKYIYILDAFEDVEKDIKKKQYNPLKNDFKSLSNDDFSDKYRKILTQIMALCCEEVEYLPLVENVEIINNILYLGVWNKFDQIVKKRKQEELK